MIKFSELIRTETYVELTTDKGEKMFMPTTSTIFVDDNSGAISVKNTASRKTIGYVISGGTPPVPPEPQFGWKATWQSGCTVSAECATVIGYSNRVRNPEPCGRGPINVEFGECVETLDRQAMGDTFSTEEVIIPSSVKKMDAVWARDSSLGNLIFKSTTPPEIIGDEAQYGFRFMFRDDSYYAYVPDESLEAYIAADGFNKFPLSGRIKPISEKP